MSYSKGSLWQLLKCRIIRQIMAVINNRHIKTVTLYTFFCSVGNRHYKCSLTTILVETIVINVLFFLKILLYLLYSDLA